MRSQLKAVAFATAIAVGSWSGPAWAQHAGGEGSGTEEVLGGPDGVVTHALGAVAADLVFTPVTPCRVIDTRASAAGQLVAGTEQSFLVRNAGGFAAQGGSATDCGIPATASAAEMNFVAVAPVGAGDLRVAASPNPLPNASVLNYASVPGLNIANGIAQPICVNGAVACAKDITILADVSNTHLVVDVVGYFKPPVRPTTITLSDSAGSTASTTAVTIASMLSDLLAKGYTRARLVARFNNTQEAPACTGTVTLQFVDTDRARTLATLSRPCAAVAWYDQSAIFAIQAAPGATGSSYALQAFVENGIGTWRWVALEIW